MKINLSKASNGDLTAELERRGLRLSIWRIEDAYAAIEDDQNPVELSARGMKRLAQALLDTA